MIKSLAIFKFSGTLAFNSFKNSSLHGYQDSSTTAASSVRRSFFVAKIEPSTVTKKIVTYIFKTKKFYCKFVILLYFVICILFKKQV